MRPLCNVSFTKRPPKEAFTSHGKKAMPWLRIVNRVLAAIAVASVALAASAATSAANPLHDDERSVVRRRAVPARQRQDASGSGAARTTTHASGATLGLALRCASAGNRIELRAQLASRGNRVFGIVGGAQLQCFRPRIGSGSRQQPAPLHPGQRPVRLHGGDDQRPLAIDLGAHRHLRAARRQHQPASPVTARRTRSHARNGLELRSSPIVLMGPWPQMKTKSSPSGSSLVLMPLIRAS